MASTSIRLGVSLQDIQKAQMESDILTLMEVCPELEGSTARMLIYKFANLEEALDAALRLSTQADPRHFDSTKNGRRSSSASQISHVEEEDDEDFLPGLRNPAKRAMARQLVTEFPGCDRKELVRAVRCSRNVDDAAGFLFDGTCQTDKNASEVSVKSEGMEDSPNLGEIPFQAENYTPTTLLSSTSALHLRPVAGVIPSFRIRTRTVAEDIAASPDNAFVFTRKVTNGGGAGPSPPSATTSGGDKRKSYEPVTQTPTTSTSKEHAKVLTPTDDDEDVDPTSNSTTSPNTDEEPATSRASLAGTMSNSPYDSKISVDDIGEYDEDTQITDAANDEYEDRDAKLAYLLELFPNTSPTALANELLIQGGNVQETADQLLKENATKRCRNTKDLSGSFEDQDHDEEQEAAKTGPSKMAISEAKVKPSLKRPADEKLEGPNPLKKTRMNGFKTMSQLPSASEWVRKTYDAQGAIQVGFDNGVKHPCKFPKSVLENFKALQKDLAAFSADNAEPSIKVPDIDSATWDIAIQWIVCSDIQVDVAQRRTGADELSAVLRLIEFAVKLGLDLHLASPTSVVISTIRRILTDNRESLRGRHVKFAYSFPRGHPLRELFVKATFRPWLEFRYHPTDDSDDGGSDPDLEGEDTATKSFFGNKGFWLNKVLKGSKAVYGFKKELFELLENAWHRREVSDELPKKKGSKKTKTRIKDPFTEEFFVII